MYKLTLYLIFILLLYSCSPINKQHGYMLDDLISASSKIEQMDIKKYHKNDILELLGSPSIKIKDIDDVWIYLISLKEEKIFENDEINYQQVFRFSFDSKGFIIQSDILDKNNYNEIAFSTDKTTVTRDAYGISDQIYDAFTRGN